MILRRVLTLSLALVLVAAPLRARADDAAQCKDGYDRSQIARDAGKLLEARALLQQCSTASCSSFIQRECAGWFTDVDARMPSVIFSAKDGDGADLVDVEVTIDGAAGPRKLDGRPLDVDPGEHTFSFRLANGKTAERRALIREREKGKTISVVIGEPTPAASLASQPPKREGASPLKIGGFVGGGVGVASLVAGTILGLVASSKLSAPQCDTTAKVCDAGVLSSARTAATWSTVTFITGGVLVAGGVTIVVLAPERTPANGAPLRPTNAGGLSLQGAW
jgi:hypothetical protein